MRPGERAAARRTRRPPAPARSCGSYLLPRAGAEEARGPEDEQEDEDSEDEGARPLLAHVLAAERPDEADDDPAEHRARQVADPAQHRGREGVEAVLVAHLERHRADRQAVD